MNSTVVLTHDYRKKDTLSAYTDIHRNLKHTSSGTVTPMVNIATGNAMVVDILSKLPPTNHSADFTVVRVCTCMYGVSALCAYMYVCVYVFEHV